MPEEKHIRILRNGIKEWNQWRTKNPKLTPNLSNVDFVKEFPSKDEIYNLPNFNGCNFSNVDLHGVTLRNGYYTICCFDGYKINFSDLVDAYFTSCTFKKVEMRVTEIGSATFNNCIFEDSDLSYFSAEDTSFTGSEFINTRLENVSFVSNDFSETKLIGCSVYGISSWDLKLGNSIQKDLIITKEGQPRITVDNMELAQFLYLIINNSRLRNVIDTITSKVVLILGNFSPKRKIVLDEIREKLRQNDFIPVMFDFEKPTSRNLTETVFTLANISRFVIADLSSPRSIGHELSAIIPKLQSVNFYPTIIKGEREYGMFEEFMKLPWVKKIKEYEDNRVDDLLEEIIASENS